MQVLLNEWFPNTVWCRYNTVNFIKNIYKRHPISRPLGRNMGCLLWIQHLIDILLQFLQQLMQCVTELDRVITALDCTHFSDWYLMNFPWNCSDVELKPQGFTDDSKTTSVEAMDWCLTTPSHCLNPCWARSVVPFEIQKLRNSEIQIQRHQIYGNLQYIFMKLYSAFNQSRLRCRCWYNHFYLFCEKIIYSEGCNLGSGPVQQEAITWTQGRF